MKHGRTDYDLKKLEKKIPDDEPVFLFRGQDIGAPKMIEMYAEYIASMGAKSDIVEAAREQANKMREWQKNKKAKVPDMK